MDPWHELGLDPADATPDAVRAARRRLAKEHHPDLTAGRGDGGEANGERLARANRAVELALAELSTRGEAAARERQPGREGMAGPPGDDRTEVTFSVPHLPVEAFELLLLAFSAIGDPKVQDEPYLLEGMVDDPHLGTARVEIVPEAGGSIVTVTTSPHHRARTAPPTPYEVAGRLLFELGALEG